MANVYLGIKCCSYTFIPLFPSPHLWSKICNVGLLFLQGSLRDKHGEVAVLHTQLLDLPVKEFFDGIPDRIRPRPQHVTATDVVILDHLSLGDHLKTAKTMILVKNKTVLLQFTK